MSKITITRTSEWANRMRQISLYMDGEKIGTIGNGETRVFDVGPGIHKLTAKIDWCTSRDIPFTMDEGGKKYFRLSGFPYSNLISAGVIGTIILHYILRTTIGINWIVWLAVPFFLLLLYYISFGRRKYLTLKETESW
jgi:hypothetical protein